MRWKLRVLKRFGDREQKEKLPRHTRWDVNATLGANESDREREREREREVDDPDDNDPDFGNRKTPLDREREPICSRF